MDENIVKFQEKLRELVSLGKKKKGILEIQEINDFFSDMELDSDQMEKVFDYLEANNVDVLRISNDDDDIPDDIVMFHTKIKELTTVKEQEKALQETILRVKDHSIEEATKNLDPTDIQGLQRLMNEKRKMQDLRTLHISIN